MSEDAPLGDLPHEGGDSRSPEGRDVEPFDRATRGPRPDGPSYDDLVPRPRASAWNELTAWGRRHRRLAVVLATIEVTAFAGLVWWAQDQASERERAVRAFQRAQAAVVRAAAGIRQAEGSRLAALARLEQSEDETLALDLARRAVELAPEPESYDAIYAVLGAHRELARLHGLDGGVTALALDPHVPGGRVVAGDDSGLVVAWDVDGGKVAFRAVGGTPDAIRALAVSRTGAWVAVAGPDESARLLSGADGRLAWALPEPGGGVSALSFSPDGSRLAVATRRGAVQVVDVPTGDVVFERPIGADRAEGIAFRPDGLELASVGSDDVVRFLDASSGERTGDVTVAPTGRRSARRGGARVVYDQNGRFVVASSPAGLVRAWRAAGHERVLAVGDEAHPCDGFALGGSRVLVRIRPKDGGGAVALVVDLESGKGVSRFLGLPTLERDLPVAIDEAGARVALPVGALGRYDVREVSSGRRLAEIRGHEGDVTSVAFAAGGAEVVTASADRTVRVWEVFPSPCATGFLGRAPAEGHGEVALFPDGERAAVLQRDGDGKPARVFTVNLATGRELRDLTIGGEPEALVTARGADRVGVRDAAGTLHVFDGDAETESWSVALGREGTVLALFAEDRGLAIAGRGGRGRVKIVSAGLPDVGREVPGRAAPTAVARTPDGKALAVAGADGGIRLVDLASGRDLGSRVGLPQDVSGLVFAYGGAVLVAWSSEAIDLMDVPSLAARGRIVPPEGRVLAVGAKGGEPWIVVVTEDGLARAWPLRPAEAAKNALPSPLPPKGWQHLHLATSDEIRAAGEAYVDAAPSARDEFALGRALVEAGDLDAATKRFAKAQRLRPDLEYGELGLAFVDAGRARAALPGSQDERKAEASALEHFRRAVEGRDASRRALAARDPLLAPLDHLEAFRELANPR